ncbi:MAG: GNAT family N-acetyltransferase [Chitinophagaceae bacterium]|jgi:putative acetyltransferase
MKELFVIQRIQAKHNKAIATIIRQSLEEFGANKKGTVYFDESTDNLFDLFNNPSKHFYLVASIDNEIVGGAGIFNTDGLPANTCELVKMYLKKEFRGKGLGYNLISECMQLAKQLGYTKMYLETMPELKKAVEVYEKFGFKKLNHPLGNSGHCGCDIWMIRDL